ncbi:hypothetical protein GY21_15270 [Cryobacterium roopkundense]|uniref:HTH arsR-type domain-containing protein n=1 Tax=Cryobacterium roopkundense TaxID=1001240 RepID=A0A099J4R1_9MICO|nr:hypothetical protein [Cryobacterium roopkundense]KGJ72443.1 hypothetical protein GY21_15270 [Cryobacterium roopkundense]MBB5641090.1 hypothetical protein [Cryobacterium roopkundense]
MAATTRDADRPLVASREAAEGIARRLKVLTDPTRVQLFGMVIDSPGGRALVGRSPPPCA